MPRLLQAHLQRMKHQTEHTTAYVLHSCSERRDSLSQNICDWRGFCYGKPDYLPNTFHFAFKWNDLVLFLFSGVLTVEAHCCQLFTSGCFFFFFFLQFCFCRGQIDLELIHLQIIRVFRTLSHFCKCFFKYLLPKWIYEISLPQDQTGVVHHIYE